MKYSIRRLNYHKVSQSCDLYLKSNELITLVDMSDKKLSNLIER